MERNKGITLVALVITIIILIILAGISINMILGQDGLIQKAIDGGNSYKEAAANELKILDEINEILEGQWTPTPTTPGDTGITVADVTTSNYGQYVDLGTTILDRTIQLEDGTTPAADWRVLKKDSGGVWLILADYMPNSAFNVTTKVGLETGTDGEAVYGIKSSINRKSLINGLTDSNWNDLITGSNVSGITGVQVKGAVSIDIWKDSWNENSGYTHINLNTSSMSDDLDGYYIYKDGESETSTYIYLNTDTIGYANTLYFPHTSAQSECHGYWLNAPAAISTNSVINVDCNSIIGTDNYGNSSFGVRPVVYLPSSIKLNTSSSIWRVTNN